MAGGTGKGVFAKAFQDIMDVLKSEDMRDPEARQRFLEAINVRDAKESLSKCESLHARARSQAQLKFMKFVFMLEFVKVTRKKNRLRGQQQRRTKLRTSLELDRMLLEKNILLDRNMKEAKMKLIDLKIQRNVLIAKKKHRQIVKCCNRLSVLYKGLELLR